MEYYVLEKSASNAADRFDYLILYRAGTSGLWRHVYLWGEQKRFGGRFVPLAVRGVDTTELTGRQKSQMIEQHLANGWDIDERSAYWCGAENGLTYSLSKALGTVPFMAPLKRLLRLPLAILRVLFTSSAAATAVAGVDEDDDDDNDGMFGRKWRSSDNDPSNILSPLYDPYLDPMSPHYMDNIGGDMSGSDDHGMFDSWDSCSDCSFW